VRCVCGSIRQFRLTGIVFDLDDKCPQSASYEHRGSMRKDAAVNDQLETNGGEMHKTLADPDSAERFITEKRLGERIRRSAP
jgi:hypothetical protein